MIQPIRELFVDYEQGTRGLQKIVTHERWLPHNLASIFHMENVFRGKQKKSYISPTRFYRFSSSFHPNDRNLYGYLIIVTYAGMHPGMCTGRG